MNTHARLSPSSAHRWVACPGSVRMTENLPRKAPSHAAMSGTLMHDIFAGALKYKGSQQLGVARGWLNTQSKEDTSIVFTEEMAEWVQSALDWVREYMAKHPGSKLSTEMWLPVGRALDGENLEKELYGTADAIINDGKELVVLDLKGGGIWVDVDDNYQLLLYGIGAVAHFAQRSTNFDSIRLVIAQPRAGGNRELSLKLKDLIDYAKFFRGKAHAALAPNAPLVAGEVQCQWCPAAATCLEAHKLTLDLAKKEAWPEPTGLDSLTEKQFQLLLTEAPRVRKLLERVEELAVERLTNGETVDGFKLVEGRKQRVWSDEKKASIWLHHEGVDLWEQKVKTVAAVERELKAKKTELPEYLAEKPQGNPTLAREDDARPAMKVMSLQGKLLRSVNNGR